MNEQMRKRAELAAAALDNEVLMGAFADIDAVLVGQWRQSDNAEQREGVFFQQQALTMVRALLFDHLHVAAVQLEKTGERENIWRKKWNQHQ